MSGTKDSWTDERRKAQSELAKEIWSKADEERHKQASETMSNNLKEYYKEHRNYWYGKKRTPEQVKHVAEINRKLNEEKRQKRIESGELVWDEAQEKYVPVNRVRKCKVFKNVYCPETGITYKNHKEAARALGLRSYLVKKVCMGLQVQTGGYHFTSETS